MWMSDFRMKQGFENLMRDKIGCKMKMDALSKIWKFTR